LMNIMVVVKQLVKNYHEKFNILQVPWLDKEMI
jgi:hypothetical protein